MKNCRMMLVLLLISTGLSASTPGKSLNDSGNSDKWLALDKLKHFSTSLFMTTTLFYGQNRVFDVQAEKSNMKAVGVTISLGLLKELGDSRHNINHFSWRDLIADILGAGTAILILNRIG
ncbi:MAG: DUF2279 domain-containing protein [Candidatus Marinimicrobia bacterium]|nr:DUF2279 domain-containing protein [Candidatus Neomarinimicrobiota bacterium]